MDETELSFIRCPNCRSLVPAVASRCRMCGFILKDASSKQANSSSEETRSEPIGNTVGKIQEESQEERPSRVRQRTISVSGNSIPASSIPESRPEHVPPPMPMHLPEPIVTKMVENPIPVQTPFEDLEESFEDDLEDDEDDLEELKPQAPTSESELVKKKRKRRRRRKKPAANLGLETSQVSNPVSSNSASESVPESRPEPVHVPAPPVLKAAPVMEEGIAPWRNPPVTSESRPGFRIEKPAEQIVQLLVEVKEPMEIKQPMDYQRKQEPRQSPDANYPVANYPVTNYPATGSLVGWLVSFAEDRKGISHELRDGRFFVGREQLRETDFVINHGTVSTPQCLVVCDPVSGVTIQDLMSEKGTTLIRGSAALEKSSEQVRLENGDRIRFGEYEMLFVKLPQTR